MTVRAIVAGHLCLDITPQFLSDRMPEPGQLGLVGPATFSTGGAVSNTGLSLLRMGIAAQLRGKVGDDFFGSAVRDIVERHTAGSSQNIIVSADDATSYTLVLSPLGKDRSFIHCAGANDAFGPDDVPQQMLDDSALLHFGYPPLMRRFFSNGGKGLVDLLGRCKRAGLTTSLDMSVIDPDGDAAREDWNEILSAVLPLVDVFGPSVGEMRALWDRAPAEREQTVDAALPRLAERALALGAAVVMIKAGTRGIYLRCGARAVSGRGAPRAAATWAKRELWAAALAPTVVVTANGAGDAAVAGFLAALLRNESPELALTMACAAGACCCEKADATSGVRSWDATLARLAAGWKRLDLTPALPGWRRDEGASLWRGPDDR